MAVSDDVNLVGQEVEIVKEPPKTPNENKKKFNNKLLQASSTGNLETQTLDSFIMRANTRETEYALLDQMAQDSTIGSVVTTYVEDIIAPNNNGEHLTITANDPNIEKAVRYVITRTGIDNTNILQQWARSLVLYGDCYGRLPRLSDVEKEDKYFFGGDKEKTNTQTQLDEYYKNKYITEDLYAQEGYAQLVKKKKEEPHQASKLEEDIGVVVRDPDDHYAYVVEAIENPNEVFDIISFGQTVCYVYVPTNDQTSNDTSIYGHNVVYTNYNINTYRKTNNQYGLVYNDDEFVHGCLNESRTRIVERVRLFKETEEQQKERERQQQEGETPTLTDYEVNSLGYYYTRRGTSLLIDCYMAWRQLSLLEDALLLARTTLSGIIRLFSTEVGDVSDEEADDILNEMKDAVEQKLSLSVGESMSEYQNPAPLINSLFTLTRDGKGAISCQSIGGEYDPRSIIDIEYYRDKLFGALRVPKQYFGFVSDNAGFSGGESLSLISARYGQAVKKYQAVLAEMLEQIVNLYFIDSGNAGWVGQFHIALQPPIMQSDNQVAQAQQEKIKNQIDTLQNFMNLINSVKDDSFTLRLMKTYYNTIPELQNEEAIDLIDERIKQLEKNEQQGGLPEPEESIRGHYGGGGFGGGASSFSPEPPSLSGETEIPEEEIGGEETTETTPTETTTETEEPNLNVEPGVQLI